MAIADMAAPAAAVVATTKSRCGVGKFLREIPPAAAAELTEYMDAIASVPVEARKHPESETITTTVMTEALPMWLSSHHHIGPENLSIPSIGIFHRHISGGCKCH